MGDVSSSRRGAIVDQEERGNAIIVTGTHSIVRNVRLCN